MNNSKQKTCIFSILLPYIFQQPICPLNSIYTNYFSCRYETRVSINTLYEFTAINNVTKRTVTQTPHIIGIYPRTNAPVTLYMYA